MVRRVWENVKEMGKRRVLQIAIKKEGLKGRAQKEIMKKGRQELETTQAQFNKTLDYFYSFLTGNGFK